MKLLKEHFEILSVKDSDITYKNTFTTISGYIDNFESTSQIGGYYRFIFPNIGVTYYPSSFWGNDDYILGETVKTYLGEERTVYTLKSDSTEFYWDKITGILIELRDKIRTETRIITETNLWGSIIPTNPQIEKIINPERVFNPGEEVPILIKVDNDGTQGEAFVSLDILGPKEAGKKRYNDSTIYREFSINKKSSKLLSLEWIVPTNAPAGIYWVNVKVGNETAETDEIFANAPAFLVDTGVSYIQSEEWENMPEIIGKGKMLYAHVTEDELPLAHTFRSVINALKLTNILSSVASASGPVPQFIEFLDGVMDAEEAYDQNIRINEYEEYDLILFRVLGNEEGVIDLVYLIEDKPHPIGGATVPIFYWPIPVSGVGMLDGETPDYAIMKNLDDAKNIVDEENVGGTISITKEGEEYDVDYDENDTEVVIEKVSEKTVSIELEADFETGKTFVINIDKTIFDSSDVDSIRVYLNNDKLSKADNGKDILNPNDDKGKSEYYILSEGTQVLVSIPNFSTHTISITSSITAFEIMVEDSDGLIIANANVKTTSRPGGQSALVGPTNSDGIVMFDDINLGEYEFSITKDGFKDGDCSGIVKVGEIISIIVTLENVSEGIPGFSVESIVLSILLASVIMWMMKKKY